MTPAAAPTRFSGTDLVAILVMNVMWGLNLIAVKMGVELVEPLSAAFLRQAMVMAICLPALKVIPGKMRELLALGFLSGCLFYIIVNLSMTVSDNVSALAIAGQLGAPFSLVLAVLVLGEKIHKYRMIGMGLAFFGVVLLVFDPQALDERLGIGLTAISSIIWAVCSLIQRRLAGVPVLTIYAWVGVVGTLSLLPVALYVEPVAMAKLPQVPLESFGWILFSALGSTVLGQGAMSYLIQRHPISMVVPMSLPTPVVSVIAASWWFGTVITPVMMIGGSLVMIGVGIVTVRTAKARESEQQA